MATAINYASLASSWTAKQFPSFEEPPKEEDGILQAFLSLQGARGRPGRRRLGPYAVPQCVTGSKFFKAATCTPPTLALQELQDTAQLLDDAVLPAAAASHAAALHATDSIAMPTFTLLSPRTRRVLECLPAPSTGEVSRSQAFQARAALLAAGSSSSYLKKTVYGSLHRAAEASAAEDRARQEELLALKLSSAHSRRNRKHNALLSKPQSGHKRRRHASPPSREEQAEEAEGPTSPVDIVIKHSDNVAAVVKELRGELEASEKRQAALSAPIVTVEELRTAALAAHSSSVVASGHVKSSSSGNGGASAAASSVRQQGHVPPALRRELLRMVLERLASSWSRRNRKSALKRWLAVARELRKLQQLRAALVLQRFGRRWVAAADAARRRRLAARQRDDELRRDAAERTAREAGALAMQRIWRGYCGRCFARRRRALLRAAALIQAAWRRHADAQKAWAQALQNAARGNAATVIQARWRGWQDRQRVAVKRKVAAVERRRKEAAAAAECARTRFREEGAAVRLQGTWRTARIRRRVHTAAAAARWKWATVIQCHVRRWRARRQLKALQAERDAKFVREIACAIKLQCNWRMRCGYRAAEELRFERDKALLVSQLEAQRATARKRLRIPFLRPTAASAAAAAAGITSSGGGRGSVDSTGTATNQSEHQKGSEELWTPPKAKEDPVFGRADDRAPQEPLFVSASSSGGGGRCVAIDLTSLAERSRELLGAVNPWREETERRAAIQIQKHFRGWRQQRRCRRMAAAEKRRRRVTLRKRKEKAVVTLQRCWRGASARRVANSLRYDLRAVAIQKACRGRLGRGRAFRLRQEIAAAVLIQKRVRMILARLARDRARADGSKSHRPAAVIQRVWRGEIARRLCRRLRCEQRRRGEEIRAAVVAAGTATKRLRVKLLVQSAEGRGRASDGVLGAIFEGLGVKTAAGYRMEAKALARMLKESPGAFGPSFGSADVDLIFARVRRGDAAGKGATFEQFAECLHIIAATLFPEVRQWPPSSDPSPERGTRRAAGGLTAKQCRLAALLEMLLLPAPWANDYRLLSERRCARAMHALVTRVQKRWRGVLGRRRAGERRRAVAAERLLRVQSKAALRIQLLVRRHRSRRRVGTLAARHYRKYIDPASGRPYWSNPATGAVTWDKPPLLAWANPDGNGDVARAIRLPDRRTEYVVGCGACEGNAAVAVLCRSCGEAFCQPCFDALHARGRRKAHALTMAVPAPKCEACGYQQATRLCETCCIKAGGGGAGGGPQAAALSATGAYCDVCFFNAHPDVDAATPEPMAAPGAAANQVFRFSAFTFAGTGTAPHRWRPLVVACVSCRRYAARMRCHSCRDAFCRPCYAAAHARGATMTHGAELLRYYTPDMHLKHELDQRMRETREGDAKRKRRRARELEKRRQAAALVIQRCWRGCVGRSVGRHRLKEGRRALREQWRQRRRDDAVRARLAWRIADFLGAAPALPSDTPAEAALRRLSRLRRREAARCIGLNREDDAWYPERVFEDLPTTGPLNDDARENDAGGARQSSRQRRRKRRFRRGFEVGTPEELAEQAALGGVRLPGSVDVRRRSCELRTTQDLRAVLRPRHLVRIGRCTGSGGGGSGGGGIGGGGSGRDLFRVESVSAEAVRLDRPWRFDDHRALLFRMRGTARRRLAFAAARAAWTSAPVQLALSWRIAAEERAALPLLRRMAAEAKRRGRAQVYGTARGLMQERTAALDRLRLALVYEEDEARRRRANASNPAAVDLEEAKKARSEQAYLASGAALRWEEVTDPASGAKMFRNTQTGELRTERPAVGLAEQLEFADELNAAKRKLAAKKQQSQGSSASGSRSRVPKGKA